MAGQSRTPTHPLELYEQIQRAPYSFDFYQAVRLLDCAHPDKPPTGQSETPKDDPFRLSQEASLAFAPATLSELEDATDYHPRRLVQRFFGLFGPQGPLPLHLTNYARTRIRHYDDPTFHRFLDIFHHRMLAFFYRAWARVRPTVNLDRGVHDRFGEYVSSFFGLGMSALANRDALPDLAKRHYAGLLGCQTKHADGLLAMLEGYFGLPVNLEQFVGQWLPLPEECTCRLGESSAISTLGESITVGSHIWDCQQKFRVQFGPLDLADYFHLLPVAVQVLRSQQSTGPDKASPNASRPRLPGSAAPDESTYDDQAAPPQGELVDHSASATGSTDGPASQLADTLYYNAKVYTGDPEASWAEAVAVRNGKTLAAGSLPSLQHLLAEHTRAYDMESALLVPDLVLDWSEAGLSKELERPNSQSLHVEGSEETLWYRLRELVRQAARQSQVGSWIEVHCSTSAEVPPSPTAELEEFSPDHPLLIRWGDDASRVAVNQSGWQAVQRLLGKDREAKQAASPLCWLEGAEAEAVLRACSEGSLPQNVVPRSECELAPRPSNRWHVLQAKLQQSLHEDPSLGEPQRGPAAGATDESKQEIDALRRQTALQHALRELLPKAANSSGGELQGIRAEVPTNLLVVSQDLFALAAQGKIDQIGDTRLIKAIRRGELVYDLLASEDQRETPRTVADLKLIDTGGTEPNRLSSDVAGALAGLQRRANGSTGETSLPGQTSRPAKHGGSSAEPISANQAVVRDESKTLASLIALVRGYVGDHLQWDLQLVLKAEATPPIGLGIQGHLGWSSWLLRDPIECDPDDLILDAMTATAESSEMLAYRPLAQWDHRVLGQTRDGQAVVGNLEERRIRDPGGDGSA